MSNATEKGERFIWWAPELNRLAKIDLEGDFGPEKLRIVEFLDG
jgi:hypothetical protein